MAKVAKAALALALLAAPLAADAQRTDVQTMALIPLPPIRFRGDINAQIYFAEPSRLYALCGRKVEVGKTLLGCARSQPRQIYLSNPCLSIDQLWAKEACHELGHAAGWSEAHEE